ncbi:hypothetical protein AB0G86_30100 [Streptomyces scabiei]|uniref:phosphotransferase-like protein n=1 Tax=Streptomyces scabiei TaxID=1930 RepID=UPI0033D0CF73
MIDQGARDRAPGPAARQITQVHAHGLHDFECDTGTASPADCAQQIKNFLPHRSTPSAFEKLKANLPAWGPFDEPGVLLWAVARLCRDGETVCRRRQMDTLTLLSLKRPLSSN